MLGTPPAKPPHDYSYSKSVMRSAMLHEAMEKAGVPGVVGCWADEVGGARMLLVVAIKQGYQGHSRQAGLIASQCHIGAYLGRYVIVVDEDIDPSNLENVMWAVVTRSDPVRDIEFIHRAWGSKGDPQRVTFEQKVPYNTRAIIDACRAYEYLDVFPPVAEASPELERELRGKMEGHTGRLARPTEATRVKSAVRDLRCLSPGPWAEAHGLRLLLLAPTEPQALACGPFGASGAESLRSQRRMLAWRMKALSTTSPVVLRLSL